VGFLLDDHRKQPVHQVPEVLNATMHLLDLLPDEDGIPLMVVDGLDDSFRMIKEIHTQL
jgi:hypothetical protein